MSTDLTRRVILRGGGAALAGYAVTRVAGPAHAFGGRGRRGGTVIPWLDQPAENPVPDIAGNLLVWEDLATRITPADDFFTVKHYGLPAIDATTWSLALGGLVARPQRLSLADLQTLPRRTVEFTLECSGNTSAPFFIGGIGNAVWGGASLARVLDRARPLPAGVEVVFWGADAGEVTVQGGWSSDPGSSVTFIEQFARSMSLGDAMAPDNLLCYEMNGAALPMEHGAPVRLIAPGWYGVANVKWLTRLEVTDRRHAGRFMARDYVTIREEERDGQTLWTFATVGPDRLKSAPARVIRYDDRYEVAGVAWGAPIDRVEVRVDNGPWLRAPLVRMRQPGRSAGYAWVFWTFDWADPTPGEHTITSRAFDRHDNAQPAPDDPFLAAKRTYWEANGHITRRVLI